MEKGAEATPDFLFRKEIVLPGKSLLAEGFGGKGQISQGGKLTPYLFAGNKVAQQTEALKIGKRSLNGMATSAITAKNN